MSVTKVVTEYSHAVCAVGMKYRVAIQLFSWPVFEARLATSFRHVENWLVPAEGDERSGSSEMKFLAAVELFGAIFWNSKSPQFFCDEATMRSLFQTSENPYKDVREQAGHVFRTVFHEIDCMHTQFSAADQLDRALRPYKGESGLGPGGGNSCDRWPFVEIVRSVCCIPGFWSY